MKILSSFVLLCALGAGMNLGAQETKIYGQDPDYAGKQLELYLESNPILETRAWSMAQVCDEHGRFSFSVELDSMAWLRLSTGTMTGTLLAEAGQNYRIALPPRREVSYMERVSPYYSPGSFQMADLDRDKDINREIARFDEAFALARGRIIQARRQGVNTQADSIILELEAEFEDGVHSWFRDYRQYRYGILTLDAGDRGLAEVSAAYLGDEVTSNHPAYMDLARFMFQDFLLNYSQLPEARSIPYHINRSHELDSLRSIVEGHPAVSSGELADLILLRDLSELFYQPDYHQKAVLMMLDSLAMHPLRGDFGNYATEIGLKLRSLLTGNAPPAFRLKAQDGDMYSLEDFHGKYTYLMFCTPDHYGCMMEYPFLESYIPKHSAYLELVCIMVANSEEEVRGFMERNNYNFKALYYAEQEELLQHYLVRAFPVGYLIGPDGKLILSPAPLPSDQLEQRLFRIMRARGDI